MPSFSNSSKTQRVIMAVLPSLRALPLNAIAFIFHPFLIRSTVIFIFPNNIFCQLFYIKTKWLGKSFLLSYRHYSRAYRVRSDFESNYDHRQNLLSQEA